MLIGGASVAGIHPPIYWESLLDFWLIVSCAINLAVCIIMPQLFNSPLIKTEGGEVAGWWWCGSLNFLLFGRVSRSQLCIFFFFFFSLPVTPTNKHLPAFLCKYLCPVRPSAVLAVSFVFTQMKKYFSLEILLVDIDARLLRPLHPGLPVLRVPDAVQHGGGAGLLRRLRLRGLLLLLLRRRRPGRRLQRPLRHGLRHHGRLLRVLGLPGDLHGVLRHLLPHIGGAGAGHVESAKKGGGGEGGVGGGGGEGQKINCSCRFIFGGRRMKWVCAQFVRLCFCVRACV